MSRTETIAQRQGKLKQLLLEQLKRTPTIEQAAQKVGTTRMTVYRWRKASKRFDEAIEAALNEGREFVSDIAETQMFNLIGQGKQEMIKYFLSHNNPRYAAKLELSGEVSTKDNPLTAEQKALIRQAIKLSPLRNNNNHEQKEQNKRKDA